ncbi:MAG: carcinine hydrolase/isopenicillin-N N-acyltransferase family protein [Lachnospiraceae bacterium]|nr:carcinine hydrolase/isopenicillin-N N-acyltransferase family protein [Lachnospiraceae bacterium]
MKLAGKILAALGAVVVLGGGAVYGVWHNELSSLMSFKELRPANEEHDDGAVYELTMKGGYYLDEFVAQGGVSNDSELISFVVNNITKGVIPVKIKNPEIGCSSFTAKSAGGDALFARNYDMKRTHTAIVKTNPGGDRHASVSSVDLGLIGMKVDEPVDSLMKKITCLAAVYAPLDGINDAGVSCGVYMTYQGGEKTVATNQESDKPDLTSTTFLRMVLDYADDLDEAIEIAQSYDMHDSANTSYHYMVADASGRSAILEWTNGTDATDNDGSARVLNVIYNDDDAHIGEDEGASDFQWVTNFVLQPDYYDNEEDMKGLDRYQSLGKDLIACEGVVEDDAAAMDLLATVGRRSWNNDDSNGITVHSAIYNLTQKTVTWVPNENYDDPAAWFTYTLD